MRITKIEIENVNSLKGKWTIDLEHPDYKKNHDLFVICGETGSGKTSILDAITLALYGRTPRLTSFREENELMTRQTGTCRARVTYECKKGNFVSEFSQRKAHGKIDGKMQSPCCMVENLDTGEKFTALSIDSLNKKNTQIINLDYDQFCKSIMLSQGQFDKFIREDPRSRAITLSKINGDEKYREFAEFLWNKADNKIKDADRIKQEQSEISLLSDDELESYNRELLSLNKIIQSRNSELEKINNSLAHLSRLDSLKESALKAQNNRLNYEKKQYDFAEDEKRLEKAKRANECKETFNLYNNLKVENYSIVKDIEKNKSKLELYKQIKDETYEKSQKASEELKNFTLQLESNEKLWREVREIDIEIENCTKNFIKSDKRKSSAQKNFEDQDKRNKDLTWNIDVKEKDVCILKDFIDEHSQDKSLTEMVPALRQISRLFKDNKEKLTLERNNLTEKRHDLEEFDMLKDKYSREYDDASLRLKQIVNDEYLTISYIIRGSLDKNKACPVCGSLSHPLCDDKESNNESLYLKNDSYKVAQEISLLNEKIKSCKEKSDEVELSISRITKDIESIESNIKEKIAEIKSLVAGFNEYIKDICDCIEEDIDPSLLDKVIESLENRGKVYKAKEESYNTIVNDIKILRTQKASLNIEQSEKELNLCIIEFNEIKDNIENIKNKRETLFGDKDVDIEEQNFKFREEKLKSYLDMVNKDNQDACDNYNKTEAVISQEEKSIKQKIEKENELKNSLEILYLEKGFDTLEILKQSFMTEDEYSSLTDKKDSLLKEDIATNKEVQVAIENLEKEKALNITCNTYEDLKLQKSEKEKLNAQDNQKIGEIKNKLDTDQKERTKYKEKEEEYQKAKEQKVLWENIKNYIGKKNGDDFNMFVQSLSFKTLLKKANKYVFAISGKYTLIQKDGDVDFVIHDVNYPDTKDDRSISNMSGGEKFIISLSLALGIAELASRNVKVDSLFLDEGFGTLSGEALIESVNALKSLQNSGKMLGIITHVDTVINEFDQKIEAKKKAGGYSELIGSGITHG